MSLPIAPIVAADIVNTQAALAVTGTFTYGTNAWTVALAWLTQTDLDLASVIEQSDSVIAQAIAGPNVIGTSIPSQAILGVNALITVTGYLAGALQQAGYIQRALNNLENVST
jgi:ABC-type Fe3+ transport system substrate-binding protein